MKAHLKKHTKFYLGGLLIATILVAAGWAYSVQLHTISAQVSDTDGDGVDDGDDNCEDIPNAGQHDHNANGIGDVCELTTVYVQHEFEFCEADIEGFITDECETIILEGTCAVEVRRSVLFSLMAESSPVPSE